MRLAREAGLPVVVKTHGSDVLSLDERSGSRAGTVEALTSCDGVVAVSKHLAKHMSELGVDPSRISVVYNGVDTGLFHAGPRDEARRRLGLKVASPLVLFVGNLVPVKGIESLLDALAILKSGRHRPRMLLDWRGASAEAPRISLRPTSRRSSSRVRLFGARPIEQLPDWYRAASVCVLPSRSEGVPNVLLESMACGTPVVARRVGGADFRRSFPTALVEPGDAKSMLASRIAAALQRAGTGRENRGARVPASWDESAHENLAGVARDHHRGPCPARSSSERNHHRICRALPSWRVAIPILPLAVLRARGESAAARTCMSGSRAIAASSLAARPCACRRARGPIHVLLCIADHFEPHWSLWEGRLRLEPSETIADARVQSWARRYPHRLMGEFRDSVGTADRRLLHSSIRSINTSAHTRRDALAKLCREGIRRGRRSTCTTTTTAAKTSCGRWRGFQHIFARSSRSAIGRWPGWAHGVRLRPRQLGFGQRPMRRALVRRGKRA